MEQDNAARLIDLRSRRHAYEAQWQRSCIDVQRLRTHAPRLFAFIAAICCILIGALLRLDAYEWVDIFIAVAVITSIGYLVVKMIANIACTQYERVIRDKITHLWAQEVETLADISRRY